MWRSECSTLSRQRNEWEPPCEVLIGRLLLQQSEAWGRRQDPPPGIRSCGGGAIVWPCRVPAEP